MPSGGRKAALVLPPTNFYDPEFFVVRDALSAAGVEVRIYCNAEGEAVGAQGGRVQPDAPLGELRPGDFDLVCVIGGTGTLNYLYHDESLGEKLREARDLGKRLAGICAGATTLAKFGVLTGRTATGYNRGVFIRAGVIYSFEKVVVDGPFITAQGDYHDLFAEALVRELTGR
ncbi:MAG: DJ-1/PfpI family protein [Treponema sp.]|nr:DJ-1/PfpI family protein [Treponema sp.]